MYRTTLPYQSRRRWLLAFLALVAIFTLYNSQSLQASRRNANGKFRPVSGADYSCQANPLLDTTIWLSASGQQPYVILPGLINSNKTLEIEAGQRICIRVVVPQQSTAGSEMQRVNGVREWFQPLAGSSGLWDSILLDAVGKHAGVSVPVRLEPIKHVNMLDRLATHIYEGELQLFDQDIFKLVGAVEYREARWNYELSVGNSIPYEPEEIDIPKGFDIDVRVPYSSIYHLSNYLSLSLCKRADEPGRWVLTSELPFSHQRHGLKVVGDRVWLPYQCRLKAYSYSRLFQCLDANRPFSPDRMDTYTIHWFGDTNSRRALKKITSLGKWCTGRGVSSRPQCQCDDSGEVFPRFTGQNSVRDTLFYLNDEDGGWSMLENGLAKQRAMSSPLTRIYYHRWEGLSKYNWINWQSVFTSRNVTLYPQADMVVISLGTMDASFTPFLEYTRSLDQLIAHLKTFYYDRHIILRTPQYSCCHAPGGTPLRRMQRDRNRLFGEYTRRLFKHHFGSLVHMWDVSQLVERLPHEARKRVTKCNLSSVPADIVDAENQLLINSLCNAEPVNANDQKSQQQQRRRVKELL